MRYFFVLFLLVTAACSAQKRSLPFIAQGYYKVNTPGMARNDSMEKIVDTIPVVFIETSREIQITGVWMNDDYYLVNLVEIRQVPHKVGRSMDGKEIEISPQPGLRLYFLELKKQVLYVQPPANTKGSGILIAGTNDEKSFHQLVRAIPLMASRYR